MRSVLLLLAFVAVAFAVVARQPSVLPFRRVSPALVTVKDAAKAAMAELNKREGKEMRLLTIISASTGIRGNAHMFQLSLLMKDGDLTQQRDITMSLEPPATYTLVEAKIIREL